MSRFWSQGSRIGGFAWLALALASCGGAPTPRPNVLLIVLDDIGPEFLAAYGAGDAPSTPTLDRLAAEGLVFENVWSNPTCSSTRATIQTGRYGFRTGVRPVISDAVDTVLQPEEWTLPEALDRATSGGVAHAALGKWHLGNSRNGGANAPNLAGYTHFSGSLGAFPSPSYTVWSQTTDGETRRTDRYATTVLVDESLAWIESQDGPWFLYLAFHAAHRPWHVPPRRLLSDRARAALPKAQDGSFLGVGDRCPKSEPRPCYRAMIEAVSTEIGRLLESLPEDVGANTTVLVVGDNGSPAAMSSDPERAQRSKGRLYEGGIRVPLIASGAGVETRGTSDALLNTTDLFATVLELVAGPDAAGAVPGEVTLDSRSFVPLLQGSSEPVREFAFAERFDPRRATPNGSTIRDARFKLIRWEGGAEELYDLVADPSEASDLLEAPLDDDTKARLGALRAALDALLTPQGA